MGVSASSLYTESTDSLILYLVTMFLLHEVFILLIATSSSLYYMTHRSFTYRGIDISHTDFGNRAFLVGYGIDIIDMSIISMVMAYCCCIVLYTIMCHCSFRIVAVHPIHYHTVVMISMVMVLMWQVKSNII